MKFKWLFLACTVLSGYAFAADGESKEYRSLGDLTKQANYIFEGTVSKIEHRFSEPHEGQDQGIPYTFVTYDVTKEFKNTSGSKQITLKFVGGPINDNEFLRASNNPLMDVGDSDLLFVDSMESPCPLVGCMNGRFRNIDNVLFDEQGRTIVVDPDGHLRSGQAVKLDEVIHHKMTDSMQLEVEENTPEELLESIEELEILTENQGFRPDSLMFGSLIEDAVMANHTAEELAQLKPVESQDSSKSFKDKVFDPANLASAPPMQDIVELDDTGLGIGSTVDLDAINNHSKVKTATPRFDPATASVQGVEIVKPLRSIAEQSGGNSQMNWILWMVSVVAAMTVVVVGFRRVKQR